MCPFSDETDESDQKWPESDQSDQSDEIPSAADPPSYNEIVDEEKCIC